MGATLYPGGTSFRVWAPNVEVAYVSGDFNGWGLTRLGNEGNGNHSVDVDGASAGQQYKFVLAPDNGPNLWRRDPRGRKVTNSVGNSVIVDPAAFAWKHDLDFKLPPRNEWVIEEIHIGTFNDAPGGAPGTWNSAIEKLDELKNRGINMVEVMPVHEFAGDFSWGYNPADLFAPESAYGSPEDMRRFVDECHARGIGVVLDVVYNHAGPSDLDLWNFDGTSHGHGGEYFYPDGRAKTPWGDTKYDLGRKEVRDYIVDNAMYWLREFHVDGLRLDATEPIRNSSGADDPNGWSVLKDINGAVNREMPWKQVVAEDMQEYAALTHPQGAGFDAQWSSGFVHAVNGQVTQPDDSWVNIDALAEAISHDNANDPRVIFSASHDEEANGKQRLPSEIGGWDAGGYFAQKKSTLAAAIALTSPGIPMLTQGQAMLQPGYFSAEEPIDWQNKLRYPGIEQLYTDLIHLRRNWFNNTRGLTGNNVNVFHKDPANKVIGYHRWSDGGPGDDVVVIANLSGRPLEDYSVALPRGGEWHVRLNSDWNGYSPLFGNTETFAVQAQGLGKDGLPGQGKLSIGPYSMVVLSQNRE